MAETIDSFLANLKALVSDIKEQAPLMAETLALTGKSIIQERIQREGFGAVYSQNYIPAWYLRGKEINNAGKRFYEDPDQNSDKDDLVNWSEFRRAQGLQTDFVDLTYTGRMFAGLTITERAETATAAIVRLGGSDREVDKKLGWNAERYGDFLQPNESEKTELDLLVQDFFEGLVKKYFR